MSLLSISNVSAKYREVIALKNISLEIKEKEIVTIIGANGAGKTTTMKVISGLLKPIDGKIEFKGKNIDSIPGYQRVKHGIIQVPEGRSIFSPLTVEENLTMGAYLCEDKHEVIINKDKVFAMFSKIKDRRKQIAGTLSGGEQQMLAIGRALMANPILLMLDEPSLGLAPNIVEEIFGVIECLRNEGKTILLVEQNAHMALTIADRGYVMETGKIVLENDCKYLLKDQRVQTAYLGA
jgi:branched-chain amino acid transport system ATP-binding protein